MDIASLPKPEDSSPVDPKDEIRFRYGDNPIEMKGCRRKKKLAHLEFLQSIFYRPPPLPSPEDEDESMLGIPEIWYWLAIGCKDCDVNPDVTASPVVLALWTVAFKKNKRQISITEGFREDWKLDRRSTDRVLKRLHKKALLVYSVNNKRDNCVTLLATPYVDG